MELENLIRRNDVVNLAMNYSLHNNHINTDSYKSHTKQSEKIMNEVNKSSPLVKFEENNEKRIIATKCAITNKELLIPSRSIFCHHIDCVNFSEMFCQVSLVKKCPICNTNCEITDIAVDIYLYNLFQVMNSNLDMKHTQFVSINVDNLEWEIL